MPGRVVLVQASPGTREGGDVLLVIEAMKMELALKSPRDAHPSSPKCAAAGEFVEADAVLATLEA